MKTITTNKSIIFSFALSILLLLAGPSQAQQRYRNDSLHWLLDTTMHIMQRNALHADKVNWTELSKKLHQQYADADSIKAAGAAFTQLFDALDDVHGAFFYKDTMFRSTAQPVNVHKINEATNATVVKGPKWILKTLQDGIVYVNIPVVLEQYEPGMTNKANWVNDSLIALCKAGVKGVVVDLRLNQGGNVYPMVASMRSLFAEGPVMQGYDASTGKDGEPAVFKGDTLSGIIKIGLKQVAPLAHLPVAVLIGPSTASAGEGTAAAFTFRPNTILIGEPTMGLTSANDGFMIVEPNIGMNLAVGVIMDGKGKRLYDPIEPDMPVNGGDNFNDLLQDKKIITAINWIKEKQ